MATTVRTIAFKETIWEPLQKSYQVWAKKNSNRTFNYYINYLLGKSLGVKE